MSKHVPSISVHDLKKYRDEDKVHFLLDVRQPGEYEVANLDGQLLPLAELPARLDELIPHKEKKIIVHCHHGSRSAKAVRFLRAQGYEAVNLKGGINAWSNEIDSAVPTY